MKTITATEAWPGMYRLAAPFDKRLNDVLKRGIRWFDFHGNLGKKSWYVPRADFMRDLEEEVLELDYEVVWHERESREYRAGQLPHILLPHQKASAIEALRDGVRLLQYDTGCGKSLPSLSVADVVKGSTLIVAPRVVLSNWLLEIEKWEKYLTNVKLEHTWEQRPSRVIPANQPQITMISYGSLHLLPDKWSFDCLIYDEIHYAIHGRTKRSQELADLSMRNEGAVRLGLTATPVSAEIHNTHGQLNALCPHRYGSWFQWTEYFHETDKQGYEGSRRVRGLRSDRQEKLMDLMDDIADVVTQAQLGSHLPDVRWNLTDVECTKAGGVKVGTLANWKQEQSRLVTQRVKALEGKIPEDQPTAIVCYLRKTAEAIGKKYNIPVVDGSIAPHKRAEVFQESDQVVLTMMSVNEGLDLRKFTNVLVPESYPVPRFVEQVLGRFIRLFAKETVTVTFVRLRGTSDFIISERLVQRLQDQKVLVSGGEIRTGMSKMLELDYQSDTFLERLATEFAEQTEETDDWE